MANLKLYLTSLEPDMNQSVYSQSIGGYISNSLLYPETSLVSTIGLYNTSLTLNIPESGDWLEWQELEYINIGNELMKVSPIVNGSITVLQRGFNDIFNMHKGGDIAKSSSYKELFNDVFNDNHKQYRCIAIKNVLTDVSVDSVAYDISVYFKQNSRNDNSSVKMALEQPLSQYLSSISTEWTSMQLVDTSLIGIYPDNHFKDAYLKIIGGEADGQGRVVSSFDSLTGTFTFFSSFSSLFDYSVNVSYEILPSPSQRIKTGTVSPIVGVENMTHFSNPDENSSLKFFEVSSNVFNIDDLKPNDIIYIWLEREVKKGALGFLNNDLVINIKYKVSE